MKKILIFCLLFISLIFTHSSLQKTYADEIELELNTTTCVLMEPNSKTVIYEKNSHEKMFPASMTKMMGLYLLLESIENQKCSLDDVVIVSSYAASMGGTQIFLEENEKMPMEDLLKSVAINSANDAIVAIGEHLYGSNSEFVKAMNKKAKDFGMNDTNFVNATGFDDPNHYTSAYDMAILGSNLVSFGNKILKYTSMPEGYVRENTEKPFWLVNTNKLLKYYDGLDGLKTGFTQKAGYNLTATAQRNGVRLISVVMHEETIAKRSQDTIRLLDYGFSKLKCEKIFSNGDIVTQVNINSSKNCVINAIVKEDVLIILNKEESKDDLLIETIIIKNNPPINLDEVIGTLKITTKNNMVYEFALYSDQNVKKLNFFEIFIDSLFTLFF